MITCFRPCASLALIAALQQHLFDQKQAQGKSEVQLDRMGDHRRRETVALVADRTRTHDGKIAAKLSAAVNLTSPLRMDIGLRLRELPPGHAKTIIARQSTGFLQIDSCAAGDEMHAWQRDCQKSTSVDHCPGRSATWRRMGAVLRGVGPLLGGVCEKLCKRRIAATLQRSAEVDF